MIGVGEIQGRKNGCWGGGWGAGRGRGGKEWMTGWWGEGRGGKEDGVLRRKMVGKGKKVGCGGGVWGPWEGGRRWKIQFRGGRRQETEVIELNKSRVYIYHGPAISHNV